MRIKSLANQTYASPKDAGADDVLRVLIVAENASLRFGGEATIPLHYFRHLRARGVETWMIVHQRNRAELANLLTPDDIARIRFVPDTPLHRWLVRLAEYLPHRVAMFTTGQLLHLFGQLHARFLARQLLHQQRITVLHQPTPVSPRQVSLLHGLGVPVVIGPMNGGMVYPPGFTYRESVLDRLFLSIGPALGACAHWVFPGKKHAAVLLVANYRTKDVLPKPLTGQVVVLPENGVDLGVFHPPQERNPHNPSDGSGETRFVFAGRLVPFKAVDLLLQAFAIVAQTQNVRLDIIGEGSARRELELLATSLGIADRVRFLGWMSQEDSARHQAQADCFVMPSLWDCGGAVVLEAMALGLPVIATNWGGPADYLDETCGVLVDPRSPEQLVTDLAGGMLLLTKNPQLRQKMGQAGYAKVEREYDWQRKVDRMMEVYRQAMAREGEAGVEVPENVLAT